MMSLLMDALKKAERARAAKEEANQGSGEPSPPTSPPLSLEEPEESGEMRAVDPSQPGYAPPAPVHSPVHSEESDSFADLRLSDEDLRENEYSLELEPEEDTLDSVLRQPPSRGPADTDALRNPEDTSATLPSLKAARDSVNSYFDGTGSTSLSIDELNETASTTAPTAIGEGARLSADDQTTIAAERHSLDRDLAAQQAARTVFAAKTRRRGAGTRWGLFIGLPMVLIGACIAGYYYWLSLGTGSTFARGPALAQNNQPAPVRGVITIPATSGPATSGPATSGPATGAPAGSGSA
ncbi:MAG: hypothetical protein AAF493_28940, partial [Pseudomonadota bacterium]